MDAPPAPPVKPRSFLAKLKRPIVAIPLLVLGLLLLAPFAIRWYLLSQIPDVGEPFDVAEFAAYTVPDEENAYTHYRRAVELMTEPSPAVMEARDNVNEYGWAWATPELEAYLEENAEAFSEWRAGAQMERGQRLPAAEYSIHTDPLGQPVSISTQSLSYAESVIAQTRRLESEGRTAEAWSELHDLIHTSRLLGQRATVYDRLVAAAIFESALSSVVHWSAESGVSIDDLRGALRKLQKIAQKPLLLSETMKTEYCLWVNNLRILDSGDPDGLFDEWFQRQQKNHFLRFVLGEPECSYRIATFYFRNQLQFCDLPRWQRPMQSGEYRMFDDPAGLRADNSPVTVAEFEQVAKRNALANLIIGAAWTVVDASDREAASLGCALCVLAGQVYYRDHGRFPETLDQLVPAYLVEIPIDPFDGRPLRFRFDPERPVIYSVYLDQVDNGGAIPVAGQSSPVLDRGYRIIPPGSRPLVAPKPPVVEDEWNAVTIESP